MPQKPVIHLVIPQLIQPLSDWQSHYQFSPLYHYLTRFLVNFEVVKTNNNGIDENLFFKIGGQDFDELPVAIYRSQIHFTEQQNTVGPMVCADPVHLEVGLKDITLTHQIDDLTIGEAKELILLLNDHLKQDGFTFIFGTNKNWYLTLEDDGFKSSSLESVLGKSITNHLPTSNGRNWSVLQNEVQMILHNSPLNQQRELMGLPTINSLWFWGGGQPIPIPEKNIHIISDNEQRGKMIAKASQGEWTDLTGLQNIDESLIEDTIIIAESLQKSALANDVDLYQQSLSGLETEVVKPVFEAWSKGKIEVIIDSCDGKIIKPIRNPSWKFWNKVPSNLLGVNE